MDKCCSNRNWEHLKLKTELRLRQRSGISSFEQRVDKFTYKRVLCNLLRVEPKGAQIVSQNPNYLTSDRLFGSFCKGAAAFYSYGLGNVGRLYAAS